jgi:PhoPQ-activated pathogenicity-related protein
MDCDLDVISEYATLSEHLCKEKIKIFKVASNQFQKRMQWSARDPNPDRDRRFAICDFRFTPQMNLGA